MANEDLKTKGPSPSHITEQQSRYILRGKLPMNEALIEDYDTTYPNIDGHIEFLKSDGGSTSVRLHFQIKSTDDPNLASHPCEKKFLNYCYESHEPIALIFVNIPRGKVYWRLINRAYIISGLKIENLQAFDQETKSVPFSDDQVIDNNAGILLDACEKHYAETAQGEKFAQDARAKMQFISGQEENLKILDNAIASEKESEASDIRQVGALEPQNAGSATFADIEKNFSGQVRDLPEIMMLYHAFVYAIRPFYLDRRGQKKRVKLLEFLKISEAKERYIIEVLLKANLIGRAGDLIFVTNKDEAALSLNHYIEKGMVDPEQIAELFSYEENR